MRVHLRACSKAHKCSQVPITPILIVREYVRPREERSSYVIENILIVSSNVKYFNTFETKYVLLLIIVMAG